jgi:penicillin-binding protein 1A
MPARTTIVDRKDTELDAGYGVKRRIITRDQIPQFMIDALQAREDARFFAHSGVDVRGLARATLRNLRDRSFTQGASTLTMQLARNTFDMRAKSLHRKMLELALTLRIERRYSKDEILVHYLNRIYFGAGCNGVEEAAQTYFGKATAALHPGECALLVGIIRGPHVFSPFRNLDGALAQREQVLDRMVAAGFIDDRRRAAIRALPIELVPEQQRQPERSYALHNVRNELDLIVSRDDIADGGLHVVTTLDSSWQIKLEGELARALEQLEARPGWPHPTHANHPAGSAPEYLQVAAVSLETRTGAILALVGGRDYLDSRFDRTHGARRDLGTAFEPFVASAAAERAKLVLPGKPVQTGRQIGPAEVERIARRCALTGPFDATEDLFRGVAAATPFELATALATLGNDGRRPRPFLVTSIHDRGGRLLYQSAPNLSPALSKDTAREISGLFRKVGSTRVFHGCGPACHDGWILRLGPTGSTAVWIGFDQPRQIAGRDDLDRFLEQLASRLGEL